MGSTCIVGLAGGSASGKGEIAKELRKLLRELRVIGHDRYYLRGPSPPTMNYDEPTALETTLLCEHLDALRRGEEVQVPCYCFETHSRLPETKLITPGPVILVEGILVLAEQELRSRLDYSAFVDAPVDVRLERRIERDQRDRGRSRESVLDQWQATTQPMYEKHVAPSRDYARRVLDGEKDPAESARELHAAIQELCGDSPR